MADEVETGYSYLRRLVQGRLDIVSAEAGRRERGDQPADPSELVSRLPGILADHVHAPGLGRLSQLMGPGSVPVDLERRLDSIVTTQQLAALADLDDTAMDRLLGELGDLEREVSGRRRRLHQALDAVQAEIVRRYRDGGQSVDGLLG